MIEEISIILPGKSEVPLSRLDVLSTENTHVPFPGNVMTAGTELHHAVLSPPVIRSEHGSVSIHLQYSRHSGSR